VQTAIIGAVQTAIIGAALHRLPLGAA